MTILRTERLDLRELTLDDTDALLAIFGDREAMAYYPSTKDRSATEAWIAWARDSYARNGFGLWAVVLRAEGRVIGDCGPMLQPVDGVLVPEVGYHVVRSEWGRGYATEAASACRDWVFTNTAYPRVVSIVDPENDASRPVAERVHTDVRSFTWEKSGRPMLLYSTDRPSLNPAAAPPRASRVRRAPAPPLGRVARRGRALRR
jgi:RimJ/RimL family protein N-acetyltransferase